jgi:protein-S-isoprenylcysteine O-methyltransferase Ste14
MNTGGFFRIIFWVLFGGMVLMQVFFEIRFRQKGDGTAATPKKPGLKGWVAILIRIRTLLLIASLCVYAINPPWMVSISMPIADWLRWAGTILGAGSFPLYAASRETLGKAWSPRPQIHSGHRLVMKGPYARIRHPIYLALIAFLAGITLVSTNWILLVILLISIVVWSSIIRKEEQMLVEYFGELYKTYMQKTGSLLPKFTIK